MLIEEHNREWLGAFVKDTMGNRKHNVEESTSSRLFG